MATFVFYHRGWGTPRDIAINLRAGRARGEFPPAVGIRDTVINWGRTDLPELRSRVLNKGVSVRLAANKLATFTRLRESGVPTCLFSTDVLEAREWAKTSTVFGRRQLGAREGRGITLFGPNHGPIPEDADFPLYTKFWKADREVRYHVFRDKVIDVQEKRRRRNEDRLPKSFYIRSHNNGWIFAREGVEQHPGARDAAIRALGALGLDFGAIDLRILGNSCAILEVNTAPGLEGATLQNYINTFKEFLGEN